MKKLNIYNFASLSAEVLLQLLDVVVYYLNIPASIGINIYEQFSKENVMQLNFR